jgi:uncharacterized protein (DUF58 family)
MRTVMIMVDSSASTLYGSGDELVMSLQGEIATVLALAASYHQDRVGGMLFAEDVISYIPPSRSKTAVMQLAKTFLAYEPAGTTAWLRAAKKVMSRLTQRSLIIIISDGFDEQYQEALQMLLYRHEILFIRVVDRSTTMLPSVQCIAYQDLESHQELEPAIGVQASHYNDIVAQWHEQQKKFCAAYRIDCFTVTTGQSWMLPLMRFFVQRARGITP